MGIQPLRVNGIKGTKPRKLRKMSAYQMRLTKNCQSPRARSLGNLVFLCEPTHRVLFKQSTRLLSTFLTLGNYSELLLEVLPFYS